MIVLRHVLYLSLVHGKSSKHRCFIAVLCTKTVSLIKLSNITQNPAKCEILSVIRFLHAKKLSAPEIARTKFAEVYSENEMSDCTVHKLCWETSDGRTNIYMADLYLTLTVFRNTFVSTVLSLTNSRKVWMTKLL